MSYFVWSFTYAEVEGVGLRRDIEFHHLVAMDLEDATRKATEWLKEDWGVEAANYEITGLNRLMPLDYVKNIEGPHG